MHQQNQESTIFPIEEIFNMVENWIKVYEAGEEYKAALIVELLKRHELHPVMYDRRDDEFMIGSVGVYVAPEEADKAKQAIEENRANGGEENE